MGFWVRVLAAIIDAIITGVAAAILARFIPIPFFGSLVSVVYYVVLTAARGQTIGKMVLHIKVVDAEGNIPNLRSVLLREVLGKVISGLAFLLGYVWVAWDPRKRAWHDYIGGTYVVRTPEQRS